MHWECMVRCVASSWNVDRCFVLCRIFSLVQRITVSLRFEERKILEPGWNVLNF